MYGRLYCQAVCGSIIVSGEIACAEMDWFPNCSRDNGGTDCGCGAVVNEYTGPFGVAVVEVVGSRRAGCIGSACFARARGSFPEIILFISVCVIG